MKRDLKEEIEIPEQVQVEIEGKTVKIKGEQGENSRKFDVQKIEKKENKIIIESLKSTKRDKKKLKTACAHIKNMIKGVSEKFIYKLQICAVHFPMNVSVEQDKIIIKNFLGEVKPRTARIIQGVDAKIDKEIITLESFDKEKAGQTAGNIEKATRINSKDRRVFQDGIFIIAKPGDEK
jgi:large subunit ribosomal protein L6